MTEKEFKESVNAIARNHITKHTILLWIHDTKYDWQSKRNVTLLKPYGTGVIVKISDEHFLFTAKHVAERINDGLQLFFRSSAGQFLTVKGYGRLIGSPNDESIDIAYIKLDKHTVNSINEIGDKHFLIERQHILPGLEIRKDEPLLLCGFLGATSVVKANNPIIPKGSFQLATHAQKKIYNHYGYKENIHVVTNIHGRATDILTGEKTKKLDLEGMSGGGVWKISANKFLSRERIDYHLAGIIFRYEKDKYHVVVANRIDILMLSITENEYQ